MPCDQILYQDISFSQAQGHEDILEEALKAEGYTVYRNGNYMTFRKGAISGCYSGGQFDVQENRYSSERFNVDAVKVQFSKGVIRKAAKRYGWQVIEDKTNPKKLQIKKRA